MNQHLTDVDAIQSLEHPRAKPKPTADEMLQFAAKVEKFFSEPAAAATEGRPLLQRPEPEAIANS